MSRRPRKGRRHGHITTKAPDRPSKFSMPVGRSSPSALTDPRPDSYYFGRLPYRDASAGLHGGNVMFAPFWSSANRDIIPHRRRGVSNAREADRNNQFINAGITTRAVNTVGAQLRLQYLPNWAALGIDEEADERTTAFVQTIENHFSLWGDDCQLLCDAQRQGQFGALMLLSARECMGVDGETLIICRYDEDRMDRYTGKYATFIEIVSCDRLSTPDWYVEGRGPRIEDGKELDEYGATVAYHVETTHPADSKGERKWQRVPRETEWGRPIGIHFFFRHRAGQQRNMPAIIQSLRSIKMLDKFDDAQLQAAVVNALLSIFIESPDTSAEVLAKLTSMTPVGGANPLAELWDKRFTYYEENALYADDIRIPVLPPGDKITMSATTRASADTKDFRSAFQRGMARQLNLTYEQFSGDYSETTFSSARAAIIDMWRLLTVDRILFTQHVPYPIFVAWLEECYLRAEELGIDWPAEWPDFYENMTAWTQCEFRGPGMGWVDPMKDVQAAGERVKQGLSSPTLEAAVQGNDFRDNVDQTARDFAYARKRGVAVPGMPEFVAMNNPVPPEEEKPDEKPDPDNPRDEDEARAAELLRQEERR